MSDRKRKLRGSFAKVRERKTPLQCRNGLLPGENMKIVNDACERMFQRIQNGPNARNAKKD